MLVLISTYWNVNQYGTYISAVVYGVLISTYWNVNSATAKYFNKKVTVLISTYWNVNLYYLAILGYMMQF